MPTSATTFDAASVSEWKPSERMLIAPYQDRQSLQFRIVNLRANVLMELQANVLLMTVEGTPGNLTRRFLQLPLERESVSFLPLTWTIVHPIDESSPLYGETAESLQQVRANLLLTLHGMDETTGQTLMARMHYPLEALRWNHTFADFLSQTPDGLDQFDYRRFHDVEPLPDEYQRIVIRHLAVARGVFPDECELLVVNCYQLPDVPVVDRPETFAFGFRQLQVRRYQLFAFGAKVLAKQFHVLRTNSCAG